MVAHGGRGVTRTFRAPVQETMKGPPDLRLGPFPLILLVELFLWGEHRSPGGALRSWIGGVAAY